jgi:hypothetical protein
VSDDISPGGERRIWGVANAALHIFFRNLKNPRGVIFRQIADITSRIMKSNHALYSCKPKEHSWTTGTVTLPFISQKKPLI